MDEDILGMLIGIIAIVSIFVVLPGMILHYLTKWRSSRGLSADDERMLEDLWRSARAMERRIDTLERLVEPEGRRRSPDEFEDEARPEDPLRPRRPRH